MTPGAPSVVVQTALQSDRALAKAVDRLVEALHPERIYLFGSRARGDATEDSDYDLMVVVPSSETPIRDQTEIAYDALSDLDIPKDVLVHSSAGFDRNLPVVGSLVAAVVREGRLLYGEPPPPRSWDPMDVEKQKAKLTRDWMVKASHDLGAAERALQAPPILDTAVYHCQQAFEKALKGFLTWNDWSLRKTHVLPELVQACVERDSDFAELAPSAKVVSPYAWKFRYPLQDEDGNLLSVELTDEDATEALRLAREAVDFVLARLPETARP